MSDEHGTVEFELYLNPRPGDRSVQLAAGVSIVGDITRAIPSDLLNRPPWNEGRIEGEVKCDYLEPLPSRQKVAFHSKKLPAFLRLIASVEKEINQRLELLSEDRQREDRAMILT